MIEITTVQTSAMRILIEALKEILIDANWEFNPRDPDDKDSKTGGIKILAVNHKEGMLVHLKLHAENFDKYHVSSKQILGINMQCLHRIIKSVNNNDVLTICRSEEDRNRLGFCINKSDRAQENFVSLPLIDVDKDVFDITNKMKFQAVVIMSSANLQKICRDLNALEVHEIDIMVESKCMTIKGDGDVANSSLKLKDSSEDQNGSSGAITIRMCKDEEDEFNDEIIYGKFDLKNLLMFTRCTGLCKVRVS